MSTMKRCAIAILAFCLTVPSQAQAQEKQLPVLGAIIIDSPQHVEIIGHHAYVANATGVHVYNIANPSLPELLGTYEIPSPTDLAIGEGRVHITNADGLWVFPLGEEFSVESHFVQLPWATHVEYPQESGYNNSIWVTYGQEPYKLAAINVRPDGSLLWHGRYGSLDLTRADGEPTDIQFDSGMIFVATTTHVIRYQSIDLGPLITIDSGPSTCLAADTYHKFLHVCREDGYIPEYYLPGLETLGHTRVSGTPLRILFRDEALAVAHSQGLDVLNAWRWPDTWVQIPMPGIRDIAIADDTLLVAHDNEVIIMRWRWGAGKTIFLPILRR